MPISSRALANSLVQLTKERPKDTELIVENFVDFLSKNLLLGNSPVILRHLEAYRDEEKRLKTLHIQTPHELEENTIKNIKEKLNVPSDAPESITIEKNAPGGIVAEFDGKIIDTSVNTIINQLTKNLNE